MADVSITLSGGKISVDKYKVQVKKNTETVNWKCHDGSFAIKFKKETPWTDPGTTGSGPWKAACGPFPDTGTKSYTITAAGYPDYDPDVDIIP